MDNKMSQRSVAFHVIELAIIGLIWVWKGWKIGLSLALGLIILNKILDLIAPDVK